ncbi:hypothetical protein RGC53_05835 [Helicobacter pylori]|uniref:Uncharacterized protein n=1 Tax=Helicobacter pylori TaxID=210 RepID=A0AAW8XDS8_HELPX|nr:hypothetical protein [Helicobacter pylori]MDU9790327.1 hypothetical protein [Helicobacter pylori]
MRKIKLTLKIPLQTPYQGNKVTTIGAFFTKKKKRDFMGGLALNFRVLKTLFGIFRLFNIKSCQRK